MYHTPTKQSSTADLLQPSSRDASGEDAADSAPLINTSNKQKKIVSSADSGHTTSKRPRTRSNAAANVAGNGSDALDSEDHASRLTKDDGGRTKRRRKSTSSEDRLNGQAEDTKAMPPPPKGQLQDPVGYHTNPPPRDRAVRVYADGVFDLFHLG